MLADLCGEEPGLTDTLKVINACNNFVIWQKRQQKQMLHNKRERRARVLYGYNYLDVVDAGEWLPDYDAGSIRSIYSGRFKPCEMARDALTLRGQEETPALDLHEPDTWRDVQVPQHPLVFADGRYSTERLPPVLDWNSLYEPMRKVQRYEPLPDRYREISRTVRLNEDHGRKVKVWRISRALDHSRPVPDQLDDRILDAWRSWASQIKALYPPAQAPRPSQGIFGYRFKLDGPIHVVKETYDLPAWATLDIRTRDLPAGEHVNELHAGGVSRIFRGLPVADCNRKAPPGLKQSWGAIEARLAEAEWSDGPMCRRYRASRLCGPWRFRVRFHQPAKAARIKPFTKLGAICWIGPLRRATAKDWAAWKSKKPKDYADFFAGRVTPE
jgi:hypothetical protein